MFDNYKAYDNREEAEMCFCLAIGLDDCYEINSIPGGPVGARLYFSERFQSVQWDGPNDGEFVLLSEMAGQPGRYYIRSCTKRPVAL